MGFDVPCHSMRMHGLYQDFGSLSVQQVSDMVISDADMHEIRAPSLAFSGDL